MRAQRPVLRNPPHLSDDQAARIARGQGHLHGTQGGPLLLIGQVAIFVGGRGADDRHIGVQGGEVQPILARKVHPPDQRFGPGRSIHGATFLIGVDKGLHPDLGQHAGPLGRPFAQHVEHDARGDVIGLDLLGQDQLPDQRRGRIGRPRGVGPADDARQHPRLGDVIDALGAEHVPGSNRVDRGQRAGMPLGLKPLAQGLQHGIRAAQTGRGIDRHHRAILDQPHGLGGCFDLGHHDSPRSLLRHK